MTEDWNNESEKIQNKKLEGVFRVFRERILGGIGSVGGTKRMKIRTRKGKVWWTDKVLSSS